MASPQKTYDVFISHSPHDAALAVELAAACRANGLEAVTNRELPMGVEVGTALWEALAESRALVAVLSPSGPTPAMGIEIGAARAWNKPIFAIVADPTIARLPAALSDLRLYPSRRIDDVIEAIKLSGQQLSDKDRSILAKVFLSIGLSVDKLALDPRHLQELVKRFSTQTGKTLPGERLLSELLRMRKQGMLSRSRPTGRSRTYRHTA